jgi:hypothetical protein
MATILELAKAGVRKVKKPGFSGREHYEIHAMVSAEMRDPVIAPWAKKFERDGKKSDEMAWVAGNLNDDWEEYREAGK